ncbi:phospholipase D-like domain-containing protein [Massilia terrae]|uniref:Cardiolipin synthase n=1 Tax=Massilia terrae TaxID=1811224 RepID=A0ABT2D3Y1_9BURK|nr:cardiolipin synthase [Massilia terrae]MCS0660960.1 cardiolipin synthase [Massilia terrae]
MRTRRWVIGITSSILSLFVGFLALNFMPSEKKIEAQLVRKYDTADPQFRRSLGVLLGPPIVEGNKVQVLVNGEQIFPAMLDAIRHAQKTISFETYIYWSGTIGQEFTEALSERARAGVKVHLMLDYIGSMKLDTRQLEAMRQAGVRVQRYHKPVWWKLARLNNRTHRKLLVIDGKIGFTGGVGIADKWRGHAQDEDHWRDTHFRIEGPAVGQMQAVFMDNWTKATGIVLDGDDYFPALDKVGDAPAQVFASSPTGGSESMHLMYLMAITAAARTIDLSASYFVPDELAVDALVAAARRGVRIRIIVPGKKIDADLVRAASRRRWGNLLASGIRIAEYQPTMYHVKALIVDQRLVSVGSTNFDNRSFSINDEANLNILDPDFARAQSAIFDDDWRHARPVTLTGWEDRPMLEKLSDFLASAIGAQL